MKLRSGISVLVVLACGLGATITTHAQAVGSDTTSVHAQAVDSDTTSVGSMLARSVVVSSVRASTETPITQTTVDSTRISREMVGQDVEYVLERTTPSVVAYSESGTNLSNYGSFRLRGIDQTRVNVTLNGVPLNDMIDQGVFFSNITDLLNGMHSVQVQRGVGTTSNGTASFAGAVSIETPLPLSQRPAARLQLSTGSYGLLRGSAEASTGLIVPGLAATVKLSTFDTEGYRYHTGTKGQSGMLGLSLTQGHELIRLTAVAGRTQNQLGYLPVPKPLTDIDPRTNVNDSTDVDDFGQYLVQAEWTHAFDAQNAVSAMVYAGGAGGDYFAGSRDSVGALTQINYPLTNRHYGVLGTLTLDEVADGLDITAGVHGYIFTRHNWETISPEQARPSYEDSTVKREFSAFAKAAWTIGSANSYPRSIIQAELQSRYVEMSFYSDPRYVPTGTVIPAHTWLFLNPKLGYTFATSEHENLFASVGRTGREPTRYDILGGTEITDGNLDALMNTNTIRPEYVMDAELGWRKHIPRIGGGNVSLTSSINGFYMWFTDEIAPIGEYIAQYFVQRRENVNSSQRYGIEVELSLRAFSQLTLDVSGTIMGARIAEAKIVSADTTVQNVTPVLTPSVVTNIQLQWDPCTWLGIDIGQRYVSSSYLDLTNASNLQLDGFSVFDAALRLQHGVGKVTLRVNNITDARYATNGGVDYSNGTATPSLFMQAGRNFWMMLEVSL